MWLLRSVIPTRNQLAERMKRQGSLIIIFCSLFFYFLGVAVTSAAESTEIKEFRGGGEIIVIFPASSTVAVDVIEGVRPRIVAGKIAIDAILLKGDNPCDLRSFHVGDKVTVAWKVTDYGKEIIALISEQPSTASQPDFPKQKPQPKLAEKDQTVTKIPVTKNIQGLLSQPVPTEPLIGQPLRHVISKDETLLDIARNYNLGYNELVDIYPEYDPWLPPVGRELLLPTERLLPDGTRNGILINVPELRLYYFTRKNKTSMVRTHPIGIGDTDFETPPGKYTIGNKALNPTWYIPPSLREKYKMASMPPGPDNPLGEYWLGLKGTMFGIHGSDIPWSVGRTVTHGCIRMYPEDIQPFFSLIQIGTPVQIVYEPVKIAQIGDSVFIEVHHDIYGKFADLAEFAKKTAEDKGIWELVDQELFMAALKNQKGIPVNVTKGGQMAIPNHPEILTIPVFVSGSRSAAPR